jgi:PAS domain S-box-containing protein
MMALQFNPFSVPLYVGGAILLTISGLAWRQRQARVALALSVFTLNVALYVMSYAGELSSTNLATARFWLNLEYIGIVFNPLLFLALVVIYVDHPRLQTPRLFLIMAVVPLITLALAWTNPAHEFMWQNLRLEPVGGFFVMDFTPGGWYWVSVAYLISTFMAGYVLLGAAFRREQGLYRRQIGALLLAGLIPLIAYGVYILDVVPVNIDLTAYALAIFALVIAWLVNSTRLLDVIPVARQTVLDHMTDGVIVLDAQRQIIDLNPGVQSQLGLDRAACVGQSAAEALPAPLLTVLDSPTTRAETTLGSGEAASVFDVRQSTLHNSNGHRIGQIVVLRDITEAKAAANDRERLIQELDAFAHTVAHDLKGPLNVLLPYSLLISEDHADLPPDDPLRVYLDTMVNSGQQMASIIETLLLLAETDQANLHAIVGPVDMAAVMHNVQDRVAIQVNHAGATLSLPEAWPVALGYAPWLVEVWVNYISNAVKYSGQPPLIELGADAPANGMIRFWVRDNGSGLTPEEQAQLFTQFSRLHTARAKGHGLGLSIVQRIVTRLGGTVGVESAPGVGSTFYFTLPAPPDA